MIRRAEAPANNDGPFGSAKIQRLQVAAAKKLRFFLSLGRCCQRACLLLNHRAKRGPEHLIRPPLTWPASFPRLGQKSRVGPTRKNKAFRFSLYRLQGVHRGERRFHAKQEPVSYYGLKPSVGKSGA